MKDLLPTTVALLACPACRDPLAVKQAGNGPSSIGCNSCGRHYPIVDGIPVLIASRATL